MSMYKIALNAGHGLNTAGKRCLASLDPNETREWQLNSRICNKIEDKLKSYDGYELIRLDDTTGKTDIALKTRTNKANEFGADFYLSIHHNAGVNGGNGGGIIAIVYNKVDNTTLNYQKALYDSLIKHTGLKGNRSQPLQKQNLHEVRESKMPAVLLECGFMDSATDVPIILGDTFAEQVANACVEVLIKKGGLTKKVVETPKVEAPTPTPIETPIVTSNIKKGDIVRVNENAKDYNGSKIASFVYKSTHKVDELKGDRAVLDKNGICTAFNVKDLTVVKSTTVNAETPKPIAKPTTPTSNYFPKYNGKSNSLVDALKSLGINSALSYRGKIAQANGIVKKSALYIGLKSHNEKMLNLLKQGKLIKP